MKKLFTLSFATVMLGIGQYANAQLVIEDNTTYRTAHQMLLANEMFESGEPFAEALDYDLDVLDPTAVDSPDSLSYTLGIENYEYSRYLLNTLTGRSAMGLHMMWSPIVMMNAAMQPAEFDGSFTGGTPNGYKEDDMMMMMIGNFGMNANQTPPMNAFPQFADFAEGNNELPATVAADFATDFGTTRWDRSLMDKTLNLGAMGQSMWKQYYWAQDMLGAFHNGADEGIDATGANSPDLADSPMLDPDNDIFYGGNNLDGYIGQVLTAVSINKTNFLINNLAYDGTSLGMVNPATYDPADGIKYFPTGISVTESMILTGLPPQGTAFEVTDATSQLFDQVSYLLATVSFKNMMDPDNGDADHYAYREVFDGYPFPASMSETGMPGPFDLMKGTSKVIFLNMMAMHYNIAEGTFVDEANLVGGAPVMEDVITAENAGYVILVLSSFADEFAGTPLEMMANNALIAQTNFIIENLKDDAGGYYNSFTIGDGADDAPKTLAANSGIIRGLYAAYAATGNADYLTEANAAYNFLINNFYSTYEQVFKSEMNNNEATYTPWNLALLSGALREATLVGEQDDAAMIYTRVFKNVYNQMILTEAEPSGETGGDSDGDGVPYIAGGTKPFVFAERGVFTMTDVGIHSDKLTAFEINVFPNPASDFVTLSLELEKTATVNVAIYDLTGNLITSTSAVLTNGNQQITIATKSVSTGSYIVRTLVNNEPVSIEKLIIR